MGWAGANSTANDTYTNSFTNGATPDIDSLGCLAFVLAAFPCIVFIGILRHQVNNVDLEVYDLQVLNTRAALLLPLFAIMIAISAAAPSTFVALLVPEAILESVCMYSFLGLVVSNTGSPYGAIKFMQTSDRTEPCCECQKGAAKACYERVLLAMKQYVFVRPVVVLASSTIWYTATVRNNPMFHILTLVATLQTFYMVRYRVALTLDPTL
jgi:Organic solute transporter Ostalpha